MYKRLFLYFLHKKNFKWILCLSYWDKKFEFWEQILDKENKNLVDNVSINIKDKSFFKRVIFYWDTGIGESFFLNEFETDDLKKLLMWFIQNEEELPWFRKNKFFHIFFEWAKLLLKISHLKNKNTLKWSKRNIKKHYDVSNKFYKLWLDDTMTYSSAVFLNSDDLKEAQLNKYKIICENIKLNKNDNLLEIWSGWWGFAIYAASNYACKITTITISDEQFKYAKNKIKEMWLDNLIDIKLLDYRKLTWKYDKIVSIEMMEALWNEYVPTFIKKCSHLLKKWGYWFYQFITYPDKDFNSYLKNNNFIKKYIFPGWELLSLSRVKNELDKNDIEIVTIKNIGKDYAKTLGIWKNNYIKNKKNILDLGFSKQDYNMWIYYFVYCEAWFESGYIDNIQVSLIKK